jgi:hypothetical protein
VISGKADVHGDRLAAGDAASTESAGTLTVRADGEDLDALLFDLK